MQNQMFPIKLTNILWSIIFFQDNILESSQFTEKRIIDPIGDNGLHDAFDANQVRESVKDRMCSYRHLDETSIVKMSEVFPVVETTNRDNTTAFDCDYCYTLILNERIMAQGCWTPGDGCSETCKMQPLVSPAVLQKLNSDASASVPAHLMDLNFCCCLGSFCNQHWEKSEASNASKDEKNEIVKTQRLNQSNWTLNEIIFVSMLLILTTSILSLIIMVCMRLRRRKQINSMNTDRSFLIKNLS